MLEERFQDLRRKWDPLIQRAKRSAPQLINAASFIWNNFKSIIVLLIMAHCTSNIVDSYNRTNSAWIRYKIV
jgi:hypothetical protein